MWHTMWQFHPRGLLLDLHRRLRRLRLRSLPTRAHARYANGLVAEDLDLVSSPFLPELPRGHGGTNELVGVDLYLDPVSGSNLRSGLRAVHPDHLLALTGHLEELYGDRHLPAFWEEVGRHVEADLDLASIVWEKLVRELRGREDVFRLNRDV